MSSTVPVATAGTSEIQPAMYARSMFRSFFNQVFNPTMVSLQATIKSELV